MLRNILWLYVEEKLIRRNTYCWETFCEGTIVEKKVSWSEPVLIAGDNQMNHSSSDLNGYLDKGLTGLHRMVRLGKVEKIGVDPMSIGPDNP